MVHAGKLLRFGVHDILLLCADKIGKDVLFFSNNFGVRLKINPGLQFVHVFFAHTLWLIRGFMFLEIFNEMLQLISYCLAIREGQKDLLYTLNCIYFKFSHK